jgi:hypothetical protein
VLPKSFTGIFLLFLSQKKDGKGVKYAAAVAVAEMPPALTTTTPSASFLVNDGTVSVRCAAAAV